jgi:hypothetical protein
MDLLMLSKITTYMELQVRGVYALQGADARLIPLREDV